MCVNESQYLLSLLNESNAAEFDPVKFGAPKNSGFVSLVEGQVLTGGQTLVVFGGGSFQTSIIDRFRTTHSADIVYYSLCTGHDKLPNLTADEISGCT